MSTGISSDIFPRLTLCHADIQPCYDVVIVGSGYGGSIAASRCARAGQTACVLERGDEWLPGEFPEKLHEVTNDMQVHGGGMLNGLVGKDPTHLFEVTVGEDIEVIFHF